MRWGVFHRVEGTLCWVRNGQAALSGSKTKAPGFAGGYLLRLMRDDPFQSERVEEDIHHYADEFIRTYQTIDWELHGRMSHLRNLGLAHLGRGRLTRKASARH